MGSVDLIQKAPVASRFQSQLNGNPAAKWKYNQYNQQLQEFLEFFNSHSHLANGHSSHYIVVFVSYVFVR